MRVWIHSGGQVNRFISYKEFKQRVHAGYVYSGIDELSRDPLHGYWLEREMYRWWRLCRSISAAYDPARFVILDVGAFPFTALKVAKLFFPAARLSGVGLWDENVSHLLRNDAVLSEGVFHLCNLDPWIKGAENLDAISKVMGADDDSIDFVICTEVVEHLYNPAHVLKEIARVLRPGGRLYLTTNNVAYWFYALRLLKGETNLDNDLGQITVDFEREYPHDWRGHVRFYSLNQLKEMLVQAGLGLCVLETTYDTTDIPADASLSKKLKSYLKMMLNAVPFLKRHRGHIEIVVEKAR